TPHVFVAYKPNFLEKNEIVFKNDNINSGYTATEFLHKKGCKNILTITSENKELTDYNDRTLGFGNYLKENNLNKFENHVYRCNMTFEDGRDLVLNNLGFLKKFDGIFCQQDKVALGILSLIEKYGIKVPQDIKIIGYDDLEVIDYFYPKLTSIKQDFKEITLEALLHLIKIIEKKNIINSKFIFESKIIERETT
ncbi:MAG: substrate-binding domain-containing protein, partial [Fusobacteriaceae bacterium]